MSDRIIEDGENEFSITNAIREKMKTDKVAKSASENAPFGFILRWENVMDSAYFIARPLNGDIGRIFSDIWHSLS